MWHLFQFPLCPFSRKVRLMLGEKGVGYAAFEPISWDDALDEIAERFVQAEQKYDSTAVWPYHYAGTMGLVQRDGIYRLRHAKRYSVVKETICDVPTDEGKVASLARVGITKPDAVFGNSVHDAAMLAIARRAFPVNPTPALVERSAAEGWPVYYPASVAPAS